MPKKSLLIFLLATSLLAKNLGLKSRESQIGEITANKMERKGDEIIARGNVVLVSGDYYISAQDLKYNQKTKIAIIEGEARIYQGSTLLLSGEKMKLDFSQDQFSLDSLYLQNTKTGLWISATQADSKEGVYYFREGTISGCDIQSPVWHLDVSSGSFDQNDSVLTLWNARAYLGKMPFLYIPYLRFSTGNERKSGLLYPQLAYVDQEGLYYRQPIYIAPEEFWDMTISPQIRTSRGAGVSGEFRLATPNNNLFFLKMKYFYNLNNYVKKFSAKNNHIYGFDLFFKTSSGTGMLQRFPTLYDGFFADLSYMNDIDYLRIDDVGKKITDRTRISKLNYFLRSQDHYFGIYNKYFFDFTSSDNQETLQLLPGVQYHKFIDSLYWRNLIYAIDVQSNNVVRYRGYGYVENSISLPLSVEFPLFGDYVSLGIGTDLDFSNVNLYRTQGMRIPGGFPSSNTANFFTANYKASLTSDIARDYGNFLHVMQFETRVSGPYYRYNSSMFDTEVYKAYAQEINQTKQIYNLWNPLSIVDFESNKPVFEASLSQYFYTRDGRTAFYYNVSQRLNLESRDLLFSSSMQNEIGSSPIEGLNLKGTLRYSFLHDAIESASANMNFSRWRLTSSFGYYYKNVFTSNNVNTDANFLNFSLKNDFGYFALGGDMNYDFINMNVKDWTLTLSTDIRCFGISFVFGQEFAPILTDLPNQPIKTVTNNYVKIEFRVIPLGGVGASYRFKK
ncbi:LPS-assembly protein LptD [Helicobacter pametensis]|uniref:LPS-assembly protein LptD n=1 Tax=Helicobacter pametensis TaxID=95149 RepID=UPI0006847500|nr:LPS-assembly protein LptD [Helicobacter pametensis]